MSGRFTAAQRAYIHRKSKPHHPTPDEAGGELNIVPFLDIIVNVLMFLLATIATVFTATIPVPAPSAGGGRPSPNTPNLNLTVQITESGYVVGAGGGFLAPGCTTVGAATTTVALLPQPDADGSRFDAQGLTRCMQTIRQNFASELTDPQTAHRINISVNGRIPYAVLVSTIDAVRESRPGACRLPENNRSANYSNSDCMFPEVTLGVLRTR